jgi:hypothetical protein
MATSREGGGDKPQTFCTLKRCKTLGRVVACERAKFTPQRLTPISKDPSNNMESVTYGAGKMDCKENPDRILRRFWFYSLFVTCGTVARREIIFYRVGALPMP